MIRRALNLNPLAFDPTPIFDLCWNETGDSKKVLELMPSQGVVSLQYLLYLMNRKKADAALDLWPRVLDSADPANPDWANSLTGFTEFLQQENRWPDAVRSWNQLVGQKDYCLRAARPSGGGFYRGPGF